MSSGHALIQIFRLLKAAADRTVVRHLAQALSIVMAASVLSALAPLALKYMIDEVTAAQGAASATPARSALVAGVVYLLALCGGRLLAEWRPIPASAAEQRLHARLTRQFFGHLLGLRLEYHLRHRAGAIVHTLDQAGTGCRIVVAQLVNTMVPVAIELGAVMLVLGHLRQPALVATLALTSLAYGLIFVWGSAPIAERARAVANASREARATVAECLLNAEAIKCLAAEPAVRRRLNEATAALERRWARLQGLRVRLGLAVACTFAVSLATSLWLAADAVATGRLTIGGFVLANLYMLQIVRPLELLGAAVRDLSQALGFIEPLLEVLAEPIEEAETSHPETQPPAKPVETVQAPLPCRGPRPLISFQRVRFGYDAAHPVFDGLDLEVAAGRRLGIVGASGSGKSTLIRLALRLYEPQAGRIFLDRVPLAGIATAGLRSEFGVVLQDTTLFNDTIAANIAIAKPGVDQREVEQAARSAGLHDFIAALPGGYASQVGERGLKLSGGERQRVAIARAVLKRPRIFVFDEATSMLDGATEAAILGRLEEVCDGRTTITITHRLATVMRCDEIVVLDRGQVCERGVHRELLARDGAYARLWRAQMPCVAA